jgi:hypothetical protein
MSNPTSQRGKKTDELESEINVWLNANPTIDVVNVAQSFSSGGGSGAQELVVSIWFRDADEVARDKLSSA